MHFNKRPIKRAIAGFLVATTVLGGLTITPGVGIQKASAAVTYKPVSINATTFPDPNFRAAVYESLDLDHNWVLDSQEIIYARNIWCDSRGIKSLKGIEYLKELRGLYCMDNQISSMDLSQNKLLTGIWCSDNLFTSLDFSNLPNLEWVYCYNCKLTSLNVSKNSKMSYIECNSNPLKKIDVSQNRLLEHLMCGDCELTSLDVTHNPRLMHLDAFRNKFKTLNLSKNPKMKRLDVWDNPGLGDVDTSNMPGLQYYNCANNNCTTVDVSKNPELTKLVVSYNRDYLKSLDLSNNPKLAILQVQDNGLKSLDISTNTNLRFLWAGYNDFTSLNIGNNPYLLKIYREGVKADEGHRSSSWTISYGGEDSTGGDSDFVIWIDDKVKINTTSNGTAKLKAIPYSPLESGVSVKDLMTREQVVQALYSMAGSPAVSGTSRFKDVLPGSPYEDAIIWGEQNSMCTGYPFVTDDTFGVGKYVKRQDVAYMLMRYSENYGLKRSIDFGRSDDYQDYYEIQEYAWEAVCWAATWHIIEGKAAPGAKPGTTDKEEQNIDPHGRVTRGDFNRFLNNMLEVNRVKSVAGFWDVAKSDYFYEPVYWGIEKGITSGVKNPISGVYSSFDAQGNCTRGQMAAFLWRMAGCPEPRTKTPIFSDVNDRTLYYYKAVQWGAENGIIGGCADGTFRAEDICTRQQAVTFLWRYAGKPEPKSKTSKFTDVTDRSAYYYKAVIWASENGITGGYSDGTFQPGTYCSRAQMITFLYRSRNIKR
ncbi:MAG: S-layer homology domain-containing protein [Lachnospiraceae bacterium]|nr:S-layer homology domain-containing protein [Lachnospiraceae bacterium]